VRLNAARPSWGCGAPLLSDSSQSGGVRHFEAIAEIKIEFDLSVRSRGRYLEMNRVKRVGGLSRAVISIPGRDEDASCHVTRLLIRFKLSFGDKGKRKRLDGSRRRA
jgi:hypothetical protein